MKKQYLKFVYGGLAVVAAAAVVYVGHCYLGGSCSYHAEADAAGAQELLSIAHEHDTTALRGWLIKVGPDVAHRAVLGLDNENDRSARVRMLVLRTIASLSAEGLPEDGVKSWAVALRSLSNTMLHEGPERADYIAKSYIMEGRMEQAANEYKKYPENAAAEVFFKQNPDLRAPASK